MQIVDMELAKLRQRPHCLSESVIKSVLCLCVHKSMCE